MSIGSRRPDFESGSGDVASHRELLRTRGLTIRLARAADEAPARRLFDTGCVSGGSFRRGAAGGRFMVAEERAEVLAAMYYRTGFGRLVVGPLAVDTLVVEYRFAVALYAAAGSLVQRLGMREVWAESDEHREYLLESGYRRRTGGWRLDIALPGGNLDALYGRKVHSSSCAAQPADLAFFRPFWGF